MAKKQRPKKRLKSPWLDKKWQLGSLNGLSEPLLLRRGKKDKDTGEKAVREGDNQFRLVVGSRTDKHINFFRVKGTKKDNMSRLWKQCTLVPRGDQPVAFVDVNGAKLDALGAGANDDQLQALVDKLIPAINKGQRIGAARLECDVVVPDSAGNPQFGLLRMFQVPDAYDSKPLLVVHVSIEGGLPDGNGGGGTVHN
jgi:hypothetical protein